jgi:hypothetical protein
MTIAKGRVSIFTFALLFGFREDRCASLADSNLCELGGKKPRAYAGGKARTVAFGAEAMSSLGPIELAFDPAGARRHAATAIGVVGQFDCGRIAALNSAAVGAYSTDVGADTNLCGSEKSRNWLGD